MRGMETVKVMTPYLPDDRRAQQLARLRVGEQELTDIERRVLEAKSMMQQGQKLNKFLNPGFQNPKTTLLV